MLYKDYVIREDDFGGRSGFSIRKRFDDPNKLPLAFADTTVDAVHRIDEMEAISSEYAESGLDIYKEQMTFVLTTLKQFQKDIEFIKKSMNRDASMLEVIANMEREIEGLKSDGVLRRVKG